MQARRGSQSTSSIFKIDMFVGHTSWQDGKWVQEGSQLIVMSIFNGLSSYPNTFSEKINPKSEALFATTLTLDRAQRPSTSRFRAKFSGKFRKSCRRWRWRQHGHFRPRFLHHLLRESGSVALSVGRLGRERKRCALSGRDCSIPPSSLPAPSSVTASTVARAASQQTALSRYDRNGHVRRPIARSAPPVRLIRAMGESDVDWTV